MTEKIYKVQCIDGKIYLVHHGVSDFIGLDDGSTNEKAIIQISHYLNEQEKTINILKKALWKLYMSYVKEKNKNLIVDIEKDIVDWLKKEYEREYCNRQ